jgi:hypothetical protein
MLISFVGAVLAAAGAVLASQQNAELNRELARLAMENLGSVTGGDSFAYVDLLSPSDPAGPAILVTQRGKYPVYDMSVRIVDLDKFDTLRKSQQITVEALAADEIVTSRNIAPGTGFVVDRRLPPLQTERPRFNIFISARNGSWTQLLRFHKVDGKLWKRATRVVRNDPTGRLLYEYIDDGFPRNNAGQVDW